MHLDSLMTRATVRGHEARTGLESFGRLLCRAWNMPPISVTWGPIPTACIDRQGRITLADLGDAEIVRRETVARYAGFLLHELLHRRYTDFYARDGRPFVDSLLNAIEDARIEAACIREGLTGNARGLLSSLVQSMVDEAMAGVSDWTDPRQYPFSLAVFLRDYGPLVPVPAALLPVYTEARRRLAGCANTHDALALARWVFDQMQQDQPQEQPQEQQGGEQEEQPQEQQEGKQEEGAQEKAQDGAQGEEGGDAEAQGEESAGEPADAGKARKPRPGDDAMETEPQCPRSQVRHGVEWRESTLGAARAPLYRDEEARSMDGAVPGRLRYEVRRLFENTARDWQEGGYRSGRLDGSALHKVATGCAEVFSRRFETEGVESAAVVCIDISGSMCAKVDDKDTRQIDVACRAAWALVDTLVAAGVDVSILAFEDCVHTLRPFGRIPSAQARTMLGKLRAGGGTDDYSAIRQAHTMLLRHPAQRKVCFVLTDGNGYPDACRQQVEDGSTLGIGTIALGIDHDVRGVYGPNSVKVRDMASLGTVAFRTVKRAA